VVTEYRAPAGFVCIGEVCADRDAAKVVVGHEEAADVAETLTLAVFYHPEVAIAIGKCLFCRHVYPRLMPRGVFLLLWLSFPSHVQGVVAVVSAPEGPTHTAPCRLVPVRDAHRAEC